MVQISRRFPRGAQRGKAGKSSSVFTLRNIIALLVAIQGLRVLLSGNATEHAQLSPSGLEQQLADSLKGGNTGGGVRGHIKDPDPVPKTVADTEAPADKTTDAPKAKKEDPKMDAPDGKKEDPATDAPKKDGEGDGTNDAPHDGQNGEDPATDAPKKDGEGDGTNDAPQDGQNGNDPPAADPPPQDKKPAAGTPGGGLNPIVVEKKGTGPTNVGYIKDFIEERKNPAYRTLGIPAKDYAPTVAKLVNENSVVACFDESTGETNPKCSDSDTPLIAYNSESFPRVWCGKEIKPHSAVVLTEHCTDPIAHLFPIEVPPVNGDHMPPIIVKSSVDKVIEDGGVEKVECDIGCEKETGFELADGSKSFIDGEDWMVTTLFNENNNIKLERTDFRKDRYYSTYSLWSSIPIASFDKKKHSIGEAVDFDTVENKAIYLVDDKCSAHDTKRNRWFETVQEIMEVDSFGKCGHNAEVPAGMSIDTPEGRIELMKKYKIVLALDDSKAKDHISNIVWEALASGALPVIIGADNMSERLPPKSFINAGHYNKYEELGEFVKKVANDKELWESYQKWREDETVISNFEKQYAFTASSPTCRLCRWAYAKKYGIGWDHTNQKVRSIPGVPKDKFCVTADHALVSKPFSEHWVTKTAGLESSHEEDAEAESCSSLETDGDVKVDSFKGHRQVFHHDGVTDFVVTEWSTESEDAETVLRLKFPGVRNPDGACFYDTHTLVSTEKGTNISSASIQDQVVKVTILADWDTKITSSAEGIMEIPFGNDTKSSTRRVRVIIEETNKVYDKMTEFYPSSYGKLMTNDFLNPLGVYFADSR